eukprot:6195521-Pleurochrysis_carterae.AAC.5
MATNGSEDSPMRPRTPASYQPASDYKLPSESELSDALTTVDPSKTFDFSTSSVVSNQNVDGQVGGPSRFGSSYNNGSFGLTGSVMLCRAFHVDCTPSFAMSVRAPGPSVGKPVMEFREVPVNVETIREVGG